jgi:hypothetical protein
MKSNGNEVAAAKTSQPTAVEAMLSSNTGRRPIRSDQAPRNGALMKEQSEKAVKSRVMTKAEAPNCYA